MNDKEIAELRRRFRPDKNNISLIRGCYVSDTGELVSEFRQSLHTMPQQESEELLAILKRTLSGTLGKNLLDVEFETRQVMEGEEHRLLMALRSSALEDDEAVGAFFSRVAGSLHMGESYLILLACDKYDVPSYAKDGGSQEDSSEVFSYVLCSVCPVKLTRPALGFYVTENAFRTVAADRLVSPPALGFLFPAFDDRSANIYNAVYYTRSAADSHADFVDAVFKTELPMPAEAQKETFQAVLEDSVADACSMEVVQAVHGRLTDLIEEHKANREEEPLVISRDTVRDVLASCGVPEERTAAFEEKYDEAFGADAALSPKNLIEPKRMEVCTPNVTIQVNPPERSDLIETRMIDGARYILIRADEGVEVNGVNVRIS